MYIFDSKLPNNLIINIKVILIITYLIAGHILSILFASWCELALGIDMYNMTVLQNDMR